MSYNSSLSGSNAIVAITKHDVDGKSSHELIRDYPFRYADDSKYCVVKVEHKKSIVDESIFPTGKDNGKGPADLLETYIDHVMLDEQKPKLQPLARKEFFTKAFNEGDFDFKLKSVELQAVPLQSQIFRQRSLFPSNSKDQKKFFALLTEKLKNNDPSIVRLRLAGMNINDFVLTQLCSGLIRNRWVQIILLHNNKITDKGAEVLCQALQYHPHCHSIWLATNRITDVGMRHLSELLHWNLNIKELNVSNRWPSEIWAKKEFEMHPHVTYVGAEFLARYLRKGAGLTSLSLADQRLRDDGAEILFELLPQYPLRSLNLSGNLLGDRACRTLQRILPQNPILEELILSKNLITDAGAMDIAYGLAYNSLVTILDLASNRIGDAGLYALYRCLQYNATIRSLITVGNVHNTKKSSLLLTGGGRGSPQLHVATAGAISHKPFQSARSDNDNDTNNDHEDDADEEDHGRYDLHAEALAAHRNRNSLIAHHPGNAIDGERPNRHASFAALQAIHEEATTTAAASPMLALASPSPPTIRELRASLSLPSSAARSLSPGPASSSSADGRIAPFSPPPSQTKPAGTSPTSALQYQPPQDSFDNMIASPFMRQSMLRVGPPIAATDVASTAVVAGSPSRSPSIVSKRRGSAFVPPTTAQFAVPGVSVHGKKGLTRASTTVPSLPAPMPASPTRSPGPAREGPRPVTAPMPQASGGGGGGFGIVSIEEAIAQAIRNVNEAPSPLETPRSIGHMSAASDEDESARHGPAPAATTLPVKAPRPAPLSSSSPLLKAAATAGSRNVSPSTRASPMRTTNRPFASSDSREDDNANSDEGDDGGSGGENDNDDDNSVMSALSLSSVNDLVPYRRQREAAGREPPTAPMTRPSISQQMMKLPPSSSQDDRSIGSNGSNYRRKERSRSINPFTLTPQEMTDYFEGKIVYNPYKDEMKKRRLESEARERAARQSVIEGGGGGTNSLSSSSSLASSNSNTETRRRPQRRLSQDLGKTVGVPHFQSIGVKPIRTSISDFADSGQHLLYLRVVTEDDPADEQLEHRMERDRLGITDDAVTTTGSDQALALTDGSSSTAVTTTSSPSTATAGGDGTATAVAEGEQAHPAGTNAAGTGTSAPAEQSTGGRRGLLSLPAIIEAKIHEKKYPPGHLAAVQAAHIALDGQLRGRKGQRGRNNKRQSVDAARLRRTSANAFAAGIASAVSTSASAADSVPATSS
eukprot:gene3113-2286_t